MEEVFIVEKRKVFNSYTDIRVYIINYYYILGVSFIIIRPTIGFKSIRLLFWVYLHVDHIIIT